ncbi:MAG: lysine--tRNA ligase [Phycisphaerae bacterium]
MSDQITDRRAKLEKIRALGLDPYGERFEGVIKNADVRRRIDELGIQPGQTSETETVRVAGRMVLFRDMGKLNFATLRDWTADLQLGVSKSIVQQGWELIKLLDLGDIIGVDGRLGRTKTGEPTIWVTQLRMLSKAVRPPPEKWHGLTDVEARYRRRYVDLLANPESQRRFVLRARIIDYIRGVLARRGFIEVDTPVLQPIYGGAAARPFTTHHNTLDMKLYLRISPELYLKRCLVGGLERVYEFARCFRNEGISPRHNPEFTMLELYQAYGDYHDMMEITEEIIAGAARDVIGSYMVGAPLPVVNAGMPAATLQAGLSQMVREARDQAGAGLGAHVAEMFGITAIDFTPPWPRLRYADLFKQHVGLVIDDAVGIRDRATDLHRRKQIALDPAKADDAVVVSALFEHYVEDKLINPTFVIDYPAPLCPLTKRVPGDPRFALRFECYIGGAEMANAYSELNDPRVQHETLSAQLRGEGEETMAVMDEDFVEALEYGMPPAGGLGIGIDRMLMMLLGSASIREVLLFPLQRAER